MPIELSSFLGVIGSLASVGAIPLSIWLYLRTQEERLAATRREVLTILSYQLGEGRPLTIFEIQAVIDSKLRAKRLKPGAVAPKEVLDDLVTDTIANPMLHPARKAEILSELERASILPPLGLLLSNYRVHSSDIAHWLASEGRLSIADRVLLGEPVPTGTRAEPEAAIQMESDRASALTLSSTVFGFLALITSAAALVVDVEIAKPVLRRFAEQIPAPGILLGALSALITIAVALAINALTERLHHSSKPASTRTDPRPDEEAEGDGGSGILPPRK